MTSTTTMTRYSVDDAFEFSEAGDPVLLSKREALWLCGQHYADEDDFLAEFPALAAGVPVDAALVLGWLGY